MVLNHVLPSIQPKSSLEWTLKSFEQSLAEFYIILFWRISSSYFKDVEGGNLFLTLVSKADHSDSMMMFKSGDCSAQVQCWSSPSCSSNHDWTVPAVWLGTLSSWKTSSLFGNKVWIVEYTWLPNLSKYSLAVTRPWRVIMGPTGYCTTVLLPEPFQNLPVFPSWNRTRQSALYASLHVLST
jgi:hypothetical protein